MMNDEGKEVPLDI